MARGRQRDYNKVNALRRTTAWRRIILSLLIRRSNDPLNVSSSLLLLSFKRYLDARTDFQGHIRRTREISDTEFNFTFTSFTDYGCVFNFRFPKADISRLVPLMGWPAGKTHTARNRYRTSPLLSTCILLRRLTSPCRWVELELLFGKHASQLFDIFWEAVEHFLEQNGPLLTSAISPVYIQSNAQKFADAVHEKSYALPNCVGFIDGTVLKISRPGGDGGLQNAVYNGHKRAHALKFQAVTSPDGMIMHLFGPFEGRRHDWTLYIESGMDEMLDQCLLVDGIQYCIYGDSGYNGRVYLEIPFQGATLNENQQAFNRAMAGSRITVEWMFKEVKMFWTVLDFKRKLRIRESPVAALYLTGAILTNFRNCLYPNQTSKYFKCRPPSLEEYMSTRVFGEAENGNFAGLSA